MKNSTLRARNQAVGQDTLEMQPGDATRCPLPVRPQGLGAFTSDLGSFFEEAGCPLVPPLQELLRFENLLVELSATFVNVPASQVDSQIELALQRLVEFLGIDRSGLAELLMDQQQLVVTHSYHAPGVPMLPRMLLNEQFPW